MVDTYYYCKYVLPKNHIEGYFKKYSGETVLLGKSIFKRDSFCSVRSTLKPGNKCLRMITGTKRSR